LFADNEQARKEKHMPLSQIKLIEGVFTADQKQEMIEKVTDAMISVEGENMRPLTWVLVQEDVKSGDWGIGGQGATVEAVREIASGRAKAPTAG
jgi:4-oxalocrotonate tautomerase